MRHNKKVLTPSSRASPPAWLPLGDQGTAKCVLLARRCASYDAARLPTTGSATCLTWEVWWRPRARDSPRRSWNALRAPSTSRDAVVVGAGAGLSTAAGLTYSDPRFEAIFGDFIEKYRFQDMYSGGFCPFGSFEERWAYRSRYIWCNRYVKAPGTAYDDLLSLVRDKDHFVLTTNVDHQFQLAGFDGRRLFYTQGGYGLLQCSVPCHRQTYDNERLVRDMIEAQGYVIAADGALTLLEGARPAMSVPSELVPRCPMCGPAHGHEPSLGRHLRGGRGLARRCGALPGLPAAPPARARALFTPYAAGGVGMRVVAVPAIRVQFPMPEFGIMSLQYSDSWGRILRILGSHHSDSWMQGVMFHARRPRGCLSITKACTVPATYR